MNESVWAGQAKVPPGPMPQFWSVWDPAIRTLPYDTAAAARVLARRGRQKLSFELLVPTTSAVRRQYARLIQAQLLTVGVDVKLVELAGNVMQDRLATGPFAAPTPAPHADPPPQPP